MAKSTTTKAKHECPTCHQMVVPDDGYCPNCGSPMKVAAGGAHDHKASVASAPAPSAGVVKCSVCGADIPAGEDYCPTCGAPRSASTGQATPDGKVQAAADADLICPNCGAPLKPGAKFCRECGQRFTGLPTEKTAPDAGSGLGVGQVLAARYKLVSVLGGGGMGMVYKGFDINLKTRQEPEGRPVAVKAILNTNDPELLAQAVDEREM
ncbi:MAG TPA: zinc ribbon domain-containing protein, partial [Chloroflexia bacterium]|nr:zinc ribbon domain-containing protein [Chloroflexia bacterium]